MKLLKRGEIFFSILSYTGKENKREFAIISVLKIFSSFINLIGFAFLFSVLSILLNDLSIERYAEKVNQLLSISVDETTFKVALLSVTLVFFVFKNLFNHFLDIKGFNLGEKLSLALTEAMIRSFNSRGFIYLNNQKSFNLSHKSNTLSVEFGLMVLRSVWMLFEEISLLLFFMISAFIVSPTLTLFLLICSLPLAVFLAKKVRKKAVLFSESRNTKLPELQKVLVGFFKGITEMRIYGAIDAFLIAYLKKASEANNIKYEQQKLKLIPKRILEVASLLLILFVCGIHIYKGSVAEVIFIDFSLLGLFGYKIIPGLARITESIVSLGNTQNGRLLLYKNLFTPTPNQSTSFKVEFKNEIRLKNIRLSLNEQLLFNDLNLEFKKGEIIGIMGESGAGKSTLLKILLGLRDFENGAIEIDGNKIDSLRTDQWLSKFGFIGPESIMIDAGIYDNVSFSRDSDTDTSKVERALKSSKLEDFIGNDRSIGEDGKMLSTGQKQRLALARAFYNNPEILVLDEFSANLDLNTEQEILKIIKEMNANDSLTVILISHKPSTLKAASKIYRLENGKLEKLETVE